MSVETQQPGREEQAKRELGHTEFGRGVAPCLAGALLALVFGVPLAQHLLGLAEARRGGRAASTAFYGEFAGAGAEMRRAFDAAQTPLARCFAPNRVLLGRIERFDAALDESCLLSRATRAPVQALLCRLGVGNEEVHVGRDGWLFYEPGVAYLTGRPFLSAANMQARRRGAAEWRRPPQPDPVLAILHTQLQLARRGIRLVVVPVPVKPSIHPEPLAGSAAAGAVPLQNASFAQFARELAEPRLFLEGRLREWERPGTVRAVPPDWARTLAEVRAGEGLLAECPPLLFDPAPALARRKAATGEPQYLAADTHWTPAAMQAVAAELAAFLRARFDLPPPDRSRESPRSVEVAGRGDLAAMLRLPAGDDLYPPQRVALRQIARGNGLWRPDPAAPVLLLGDSYANVYSLEGMGWGEAAGLAEQLGYELGLPLDVLARNDAGAHATREMLATELRMGRDRLAGKKAVVLEFSARELSSGDWKLLDLSPGAPPPARFFVPAAGEVVKVRGTVAAAAPAPRPGSVTYKDHIVAVHLVDLSAAGAPLPGSQALVYAWSMRDNAWTPAARYRPGQEVELALRPWSDVSARFGGYNMALLPDDELGLERPCWAE